ncbi:serine/threonine protein kinase [Undibacterium sp. TJN19]|uniref:serine/threonine protein kinase n=1 Tax=Undibacterium sp. TJN19 TaxID=3413055 RepID=UPI003BF22626
MNTEKLLAETTPTAFHAATENCLAVGTRLNDFEITGILGEGGFGIVYLAFDHSLQRTVAIKEYMPGALAGRAADTSVVIRAERHKKTFEAGLKSFINEARLLAQFDHPSLVKVYRFWEENKTAYMVMRHYDGHTLKDIVNKRPQLVTEAWLKFIFKQILEALDTLYKSKILHRDISPDNIIVQKNGVAVLLDFGSARQIIGDMTQGLTVILKPGYAPVEQYSDESDMQQGSWTDIYALAAVMYFAIVKSPPPMSVARVVKDSLVTLHEGARPGFSEKFLRAIEKALAIQPQDRPQSIDEFRQSLGISAFASTRKSRKNKSEPGSETHEDVSNETGKVVPILASGNKPAKLKDEIPPNDDQAAVHAGVGLIASLRAKPVAAIALGGVVLVLLALIYVFSRTEKTNTVPALPLAAQQALPDVTGKQSKPETASISTVASAVVPAPVPEVSTAPASSAIVVKADPEKLAWDKLKDDANASVDAINVFLQQYPNGKYADAAHLRIKDLNKAALNKVNNAGNIASTSITDKPASAVVAEKAPVKFSVKLAIKPWGTIFVDGIQQGASPPLKQLSLTQGKHKIRVTNPGFPDLVTEVDSAKSNSAMIEHEFTTK